MFNKLLPRRRNKNMENLNIVLLGKTGHGKSSTGNTILQKNIFGVGEDITSYTKIVEKGRKKIQEYKVQVFDTPGPFDTECPIDETSSTDIDIATTCTLMETMIAACDKDGGVHAFFLVLPIGIKLSSEEMLTIRRLEVIFGRDFLKDFGVLIFTHGDNLTETFRNWCTRQDEKFTDLLDIFKDRVLVTTNRGEFSGMRSQCSEKMIELVGGLKRRNKAYTSNNYKSSESSRVILLVNSKKEALKAKFLEQIDTLEREIKGLKSMNRQKATDFLCRISEISGGIKEANQGTNVLNELCVHVENLKLLVKSKRAKCPIM